MFVDESASYLDTQRDHAWSPQGTRAYANKSYKRDKANLIAALSLEGFQAPWLVTGGSVNGDTFASYVQHILVPTLIPGQTVILDNYSIHKGDVIRQTIEDAGCQLCFLPPYSPDFNPIEQAFSKLKESLKTFQTNTFTQLSQAVKQAITYIDLPDIIGWFKHAGYSALYL